MASGARGAGRFRVTHVVARQQDQRVFAGLHLSPIAETRTSQRASTTIVTGQ